jgi:hypothetical protein
METAPNTLHKDRHRPDLRRDRHDEGIQEHSTDRSVLRGKDISYRLVEQQDAPRRTERELETHVEKIARAPGKKYESREPEPVQCVTPRSISPPPRTVVAMVAARTTDADPPVTTA